ncbi:MAG: two pore domain potassium channel family protein [Phycisphaerales bacterium]|nr:MAG: two pore domain potassium channel family protein [Phycisphaerales bacterium]
MIAQPCDKKVVQKVGGTIERFTLLLVALFSLFLVAPLSWLIKTYLFSEIGALLLISVLSVDILLAALFASDRRRDRTIAWFLAIPSLAAYGLCLVADNNLLWGVAHALGVAFLVYTMIVVARYVFRATRVTWNTVSAALCIYLLFGVAYALLYAILLLLDPGSFSWSAGEEAWTEFESEFLVTALYYSLVTMTTLGYGDVTPTTPVTQMAASVQALVGQLYVAVLIARLVGLHVAEAMTERE